MILPLLLVVLVVIAPTCEPPVAALVEYGCDSEDLVVETWDGTTATEVARFAAGTAPACFWVAESRVATLTSRCVSSALHVSVQLGVFDPMLECVR